MTEAEARELLESMVAWDSAPSLTSAEVTLLLRAARRADSDGIEPTHYDEWATSAAYAVGDKVVPTVRNGHVYEVTVTDGTSGTSEPNWPRTSGATVTADGVTYAEAGTEWTGTYNLNAAAAEGWRWKAGKVAGDFTFASDGQSFNRADMVKACQMMAQTYRNRIAGSVPLNIPSEWDSDIAGNVNA